MRRAIKCMCGHCQRETYFEASVALEAISNSTCTRCGNTGAVITLNIEPPVGVAIQDRVPRGVHLMRESDLNYRCGKCAS
jgi:hypothetical protein